jgi:DNA-binding winged helix-turn-helix (wHTH) protein/tetratricopeptide (TPR) repeat protein
MAQLNFGPFQLDVANALLTRDSTRLELAPKAFAVLGELVRRPGQLVTKDELLDAVWGRRFVSESVLKTAVNSIRAVLGDDSRAPRYIETVPRRGYRFLATPTESAPGDAALSRPMAPETTAAAGAAWIGRDRALAQLAEGLAGLASGQRTLLWLGGEAGIGKTAVVDRFCALARNSGAWLASGQCIEQLGGGEPYLPLLDALATLTRGPDANAWVAALRQCAPSWLSQLPWLANGGDAATLRAEASAPERMPREFGALLDTMTPQRPLVLVIEDLHWSDHATVQLLGYLARRRSPARWMVVATLRPTDAALADHPVLALRHELRAQRLCKELVLDAFSESEVDAYLAQRLAPGPLRQGAALARALHGHTEGLPLFVANVVDEWQARGDLARGADGSWTLHAPAWALLQVPDTIAGVIERQISRLPGEWRALLEAASVLGVEFPHDVLAAVLGEPAETLRSRCDNLARRGEWLTSVGVGTRADGALVFRYAFRHALYQRVFQQRCEPAQCLQQHLAAAQALAALAAPHPERHAAELAQHVERALDIAADSGARPATLVNQARRWRLAAAESAQSLYANADALEHLARVLLLDPTPGERIAALRSRSELLRLTGHGEQALAESAQALALAEAGGDAALTTTHRLQHARLCVRCARTREGLDAARALLSEDLARDVRLQVLLVQAEAHRHLGEADAADAALQAALACADETDVAHRADILAERVDAHFQRGALAEGLLLARQAHALYERSGRLPMAARMLIRVGAFAHAMEHRSEAEAALLEARARLRDLNDVDGQRSALLNLVKHHSDVGDAQAALALLDEGWGLAPTFETPVAECAFLSGFYYCHYLRGELGTACRDAERVLAIAEGLGSLYWRVGSTVLVSDLLLFLGEWVLAGRLISEALTLMQDAGEQSLRPRLLVRRAALDVLEGRPEAALACINAVLAAGPIEHLEDTAGLARVRAEAWLALGDAQAALAALASFDSAPTVEVWAQMLALRLRAQVQLGVLNAVDLAAAQASVLDQRLPALEGLLLRLALVQALRADGQFEAATLQGERALRERDRLLATLAAWPQRQHALSVRFDAASA